MKRVDGPASQVTPDHTNALAAAARIYWMLLGNIVVGLAALKVAQGPTSLSVRDVAFWLGVALLIAVRLLDILHFRGSRADGAPATPADGRRYARVVLVAGAMAWAAARGVAWYLNS